MPSRNTVKIDVPNSYYHVYARGNSRSEIFLDSQDYAFFLKLFQRYLSKEPKFDRIGNPYPHLYNKLELIAYCLVPNHFHLLLYQQEEGVMQKFMRGLMTSYSRYFNRKYHKTGSLFETRYKASHIDHQNYLEHITRYIHLNAKDWRDHPYSSINFYAGDEKAQWLRPERVLELFKGKTDYLKFVADYEAHKALLDELKHELANNITT